MGGGLLAAVAVDIGAPGGAGENFTLRVMMLSHYYVGAIDNFALIRPLPGPLAV